MNQRANRVEDDLGPRFDRRSAQWDQRIDRVIDDLKDYIRVVIDGAVARVEATIQRESKRTVKWIAGIIVVQTVVLFTILIGVVEFLT